MCKDVIAHKKASHSTYLVVILILNFSKESDIFNQPGLDVFIIHELAKDIKFLSQKLVCEIYLRGKKVLKILVKTISMLGHVKLTLPPPPPFRRHLLKGTECI